MKKLHEDIDDLTIDAKIECSTSPMDQGAQKKLASLQSLKDILDNNAISEADLVAIRDSVMQQMAKKMAPHRPTPPIPQPYHNPYPGSQHYPVQQPVQHQPPQSTTPSLINSTNLAELLRATANRGHQQNGSIPSIQFPQGNPYTSTPPMQNATPAPPAAENPLLAQLRASGLLTGLSTPPNGSAGITPTAGTPSHYEPPVQFTTSSIRTSRPGLLQAFLSRNPNQCSTCGRRFASDEIGTEKKARHLDWHFKTKNRMLEAERRGVSRSWYVDEREWIASREVDDDQEVEGVNRKGNGNGDAKVEVDWVRAPTDSGVRCPIDQEGWKSEWSEELQEFVWRDAVMVGGRYYHMSCYRDLMRAQAQTRERVGTPDSVLGKRGREDDGNGTLPGSGVKKERFKLEV
jgi:pre-mRNA cleavage complex 2 protein Pcf11